MSSISGIEVNASESLVPLQYQLNSDFRAGEAHLASRYSVTAWSTLLIRPGQLEDPPLRISYSGAP
jgi:hypothetical protein